MYHFAPAEEELIREFDHVCAAFGVDPASL
jgi:hypothetical protein